MKRFQMLIVAGLLAVAVPAVTLRMLPIPEIEIVSREPADPDLRGSSGGDNSYNPYRNPIGFHVVPQSGTAA